ncbi:MAG: 4-oxalocrotonate tautomerase family protein [Bacteroides sp.]|nr:4-oxalocrotonate tautomerase family protein [Bacteroides sp.]
MPHIGIKMLEGRTEEQKQKAALAVKNALAEALNMGDHYITVTVEDFNAEEWQDVFKSEITDKPDKVYVKPNYDPKSLL